MQTIIYTPVSADDLSEWVRSTAPIMAQMLLEEVGVLADQLLGYTSDGFTIHQEQVPTYCRTLTTMLEAQNWGALYHDLAGDGNCSVECKLKLQTSYRLEAALELLSLVNRRRIRALCVNGAFISSTDPLTADAQGSWRLRCQGPSTIVLELRSLVLALKASCSTEYWQAAVDTGRVQLRDTLGSPVRAFRFESVRDYSVPVLEIGREEP